MDKELLVYIVCIKLEKFKTQLQLVEVDVKITRLKWM